MNISEAVKDRRSIRKFLDEPIPPADIIEIIESARWAPSASNRQMWKFVVVKNKEVLDEMAQAVSAKIDQIIKESGHARLKGAKHYSTFFNQAPVTIAVFMEPYGTNLSEDAFKALGYREEQVQRLRGNVGIQSIGAAIQNILLTAHAKGYGTCWMCAPNIAAPEIEKILGVEEKWQLKALIPLGKPAVSPKPTPRKELSEIMTVIE
ncbi:MAG: nitroreductase family protein [Peptococcaceae bacterium]